MQISCIKQQFNYESIGVLSNAPNAYALTCIMYAECHAVHMLVGDEIDSVCRCQIQIDIHWKTMTGEIKLDDLEKRDMTKMGEPVTKCSYSVYSKSLL